MHTQNILPAGFFIKKGKGKAILVTGREGL
jgi:hypothetical protein